MEKSGNRQLRHGCVYKNISEVPSQILAHRQWNRVLPLCPYKTWLFPNLAGTFFYKFLNSNTNYIMISNLIIRVAAFGHGITRIKHSIHNSNR